MSASAATSRSATVPTAATAPQGSGQLVPSEGQGFVPVGNTGGASGAQGTAGAQGGSASSGASSDGTIGAEEGLKALQELLNSGELGKDLYGKEIIVAADGSVYLEKAKPDANGGQIAFSYVLAGKIDKKTKRMKINPQIMQAAKAQSTAGTRKLVKVDDSYVWQTFQKTKDGQTVALVEPATEQELAAYQQQMQQQAATQAKQAGAENRGQWQQKVGTVASSLGLFGGIGQFMMGLGNGPDALTGQPGQSWVQAWYLAQRLNGRAEGKLLPKFMQTGVVGTAIDLGMTVYGMLDMGRDIQSLREYFGKVPAAGLDPAAVVKQATDAGMHPAMAQAMTQLGMDVRKGTLQSVQNSGNAAMLNTQLGAVQLVPKDKLFEAMKMTETGTTAGMKVQAGINDGVMKGAGLLKGLVQPAVMGASMLGFVNSAINVKNYVDKYGVKILLDSQQGRGAILGAISSGAITGMYLARMALPQLGAASATIGAVTSVANIASNVIGGVQTLNSYGLFGDEGFMNNDALRAAFLIPPLTPIGAAAFIMKSRKKKRDAENAKLAAAQKIAAERYEQERKMAKVQLQQTGQVSGAHRAEDGSVTVTTNIPTSMEQLAAQLSGTAVAASSSGSSGASGSTPTATAGPTGSALEQQRQQLMMTGRPMR